MQDTNNPILVLMLLGLSFLLFLLFIASICVAIDYRARYYAATRDRPAPIPDPDSDEAYLSDES